MLGLGWFSMRGSWGSKRKSDLSKPSSVGTDIQTSFPEKQKQKQTRIPDSPFNLFALDCVVSATRMRVETLCGSLCVMRPQDLRRREQSCMLDLSLLSSPFPPLMLCKIHMGGSDASLYIIWSNSQTQHYYSSSDWHPSRHFAGPSEIEPGKMEWSATR